MVVSEYKQETVSEVIILPVWRCSVNASFIIVDYSALDLKFTWYGNIQI